VKPDQLPEVFRMWVSAVLLEFTLKKRTNVSFLFFFVDFGFLDSLGHWVNV
jgi:hypothetical protein